MQKDTARRRIWKWIRIVFLVYVVIGIALYFLQAKLLFHPLSLPADHVFAFKQPFKEINLAVSEKKNLSIVQFTVPDSLRRGVVLYFHGNKRNIERYAGYASHFTRNNYEVWMIDYPGYGKSTGELTEQILYQDASTFYKMARAKIHADSIVIYGKSLGTGLATYIASREDCKFLILEAPYLSIDDLASHYAPIYPTSWFCKYHFQSRDRIADVDAPITILHGTSDEIIPYSQAKKLAAIAGNKAQLVAIEKGKHNDLAEYPLFEQTIDSVLKKR